MTPRVGGGVAARVRAWGSVALAVVASAAVLAASQGAQRPAPLPGAQTPSLSGKKYTGSPISVDLQGADLRTVLRSLADIGGLNLVLDPSVPANGKVDIKLTDVPWDQALDVVIKTSQLRWEVDGTVVRVLSADLLRKELDASQKDLDAQNEAVAKQSTKAESFVLSYAKGADLLKVLNAPGLLGKYGRAQFDERSNTVIVSGLPDDFEMARSVIRQLDQPERQVEIEARIVQTNRDSARELGIQWGFNGRASPALGNTSSQAFPNSGSVGGRAGTQQPNDPRATALEATGTAVKLGVTNPTSAVGLALGAISGAFNLDVALSALERSGKGRVLSSPKVTTQNNYEAEMTQGVQIPIQTVANNTVTVQFKDATLTLRVKPQITAAGTVVMTIVLENATPDFSKSVNGIPPINTQRASTLVQVPDGAMTIIGGIEVRTEQSSTDRTPGLSRLPLLGWLFRHDSQQDERRELLIFITPRIIRSAS